MNILLDRTMRAMCMQVTFIERHHKRRIINMDAMLDECNSWTPLHLGTQARCTSVQFERTDDWLTHFHVIRHTDILVGMHGAGLVNSFFLRRNAAFVEIFPCGIGGSPFFDSFREPHRIEAAAIGVSLFIWNGSLCVPYLPKPYEQENEDLNWSMGPSGIAGTRARDADVKLQWEGLKSAFDRILAIDGKRDIYLQLLHEQPDYFNPACEQSMGHAYPVRGNMDVRRSINSGTCEDFSRYVQ
eukprot:jgi/Botrbrau1/22252/Bobra.0138s0014.1